MKRLFLKAVILAIGISVMTAITGCEETNSSNTKPSTKKHRLIASENLQLKKEINRLGEEAERQKKRYEAELEKQKKLLAKCQKEKKYLEQQSAETFKKELDNIANAVMEENKELKAKIGQLKKEILQLKRELERHEGPTPLESGAN